MSYVTESNLTDLARERWGNIPDPRLREVMTALVEHVHAFLREIEPTEAEWATAIDWLTRGQHTPLALAIGWVTVTGVVPPPHGGSWSCMTGLTWNEVAEQVDMTVLVPGAATGGPGPPKPPRLGRWQQVLADALDQNLAIGVRAAVADHLGRAPTRAELTAARGAGHSLGVHEFGNG